jgi:hypothetical protein
MYDSQQVQMIAGNGDEFDRVQMAQAATQEVLTDDMVAAMCDLAIKTLEMDVRLAVLEMLELKAAERAADYFSVIALNGTDRQRRWAYMNLSLIECRSKKEVVIRGLYDLDPAVRRAAAMSAGLYLDDDFLQAIIFYFERSEYDYLSDIIFHTPERIRLVFTQIKSKISSVLSKPEAVEPKKGDPEPVRRNMV